MVVPDTNPWVLPVGFLQVLVALVASMALAVVRQRHGLAVGPRHAVQRATIAIFPVRVFVLVVAQMQHAVQVMPPRNERVGVEQAIGIVRARREG